eukprot:TRINITY_DN666_c0_g1_i6.p1 TRINITY_DN666_c0_g1~~TRINITY_DN666_c0_g1_i6.p1  ORF type:complete len:167 (-),score=26.44 TRINITY_DN666_c0_g1_i6:44-544(-)
MKHTFVSLVVASVAVVQSSMESFESCIRQKLDPAAAQCGDHRPRCTPACESEMGALDGKFNVCCMEVPTEKRSQCEIAVRQWPRDILSMYHRACPRALDDFTVALLEAMPFGLHAHDEPVVAVAKETRVNVGTVAVGAALAGAIGASVALAVASWSARKQDVLLAN